MADKAATAAANNKKNDHDGSRSRSERSGDWADADDRDRARPRERWVGDEVRDGDKNGREDDYQEDVSRGRVGPAVEDPEKDILDLKVLAELKGVFDRFAVEGAMTATETCQGLTEAGVIAPRR